jgi:hypothetical protein
MWRCSRRSSYCALDSISRSVQFRPIWPQDASRVMPGGERWLQRMQGIEYAEHRQDVPYSAEATQSQTKVLVIPFADAICC